MNTHEVMEDAIASAKKARKEQKAYAKKHADHFIAIANALIPLEKYLIRITLDKAQSIDITVAGDHHVLNGAFSALRKLGYTTNDRPTDEKTTTYNAWWHKENWPSIWFVFTSTKCRLHKVGTKMVEQDVYEVVCK